MNHPHKRQVPKDKVLVSSVYHLNVMNSIYSSILGQAKNYIKTLFPIDFFKSEFIGNSLYAVTNATIDEDDSFVQERPALAITMKLDPEDPTFAGDNFLMDNIHIRRAAWSQPSIFTRMAWDRNHGTYISASPFRYKNSFDIVLTLNSEMQAINIYGYLKSKLGINRPVFLNKKPIEVPIPPSLIGTLAAARSIDLSKIEEFTKLHDFIEEISNGNITYKYHNTSGRYLYFFKYYTNILFTMTSLDSIDNEKTEKTTTKSTVKFTITMEYDYHSAYYLESFQNLPKPITSKYLIDDFGIGVVLHSTFDTPISSQHENGHKVAFSIDIVTDIGTQVDETLFKDHIHPENLQFINHLLEEDKIDEDTTTILYCDAEPLEKGIDYEVDWRHFKLKILNPKSNYDYKFIIYMDMLKANKYHEALRNPRNI